MIEEEKKELQIGERELIEAGLLQPSSLREIAGRVDDDVRNRVTVIRIDRGENVNSLDGMELFTGLKILWIYKSKIKTITGHPVYNPYLNRLLVESDYLEDISDIALFENMLEIDIRSNSLVRFPDITHMEKLRSLDLQIQNGFIFNELKLPSKIKILELENCNIKSLEEVSDLFNYCRYLRLGENPIKEIDWNMDFGTTVEEIHLGWCPVAKDYYDEETHEGTSFIEVRGVRIFFRSEIDDEMTLDD
jgi:hypothetical protein